MFLTSFSRPFFCAFELCIRAPVTSPPGTTLFFYYIRTVSALYVILKVFICGGRIVGLPALRACLLACVRARACLLCFRACFACVLTCLRACSLACSWRESERCRCVARLPAGVLARLLPDLLTRPTCSSAVAAIACLSLLVHHILLSRHPSLPPSLPTLQPSPPIPSAQRRHGAVLPDLCHPPEAHASSRRYKNAARHRSWRDVRPRRWWWHRRCR